MSKTQSYDESETLTTKELEHRLCAERKAHELLVAGFLRQCGTESQPWHRAIVEFSRRSLENWEDPVNFILPGDVARANALRAEGNSLFGEKKYALAVAKYEEAHAWFPNGHLSKCNLALCYARVDEWQLSFENAKSAILKRADYCKAWLRLAEACAHLDKVVLAAFAYRIAHSLSKSQSQFSEKRVKGFKKLSSSFEEKRRLTGDQLNTVKRLCEGRLLAKVEIMDHAFGLEHVQNKIGLERCTLQCYGRVALSKVLIPKLRPNGSWGISWFATPKFSHNGSDEICDATDQQFELLQRKYGEEYALDACYPQYLTFDDRMQRAKRAVVFTVCNRFTSKCVFMRSDYGVPGAQRIVDNLLHAMVAPMDGSKPMIPQTLVVAYRMRHESAEIKRLLRARVNAPIFMTVESYAVSLRAARAQNNDANGWNQQF